MFGLHISKRMLDLEHNSRRGAIAPVCVADKARSLNMEIKILFSFGVYPFLVNLWQEKNTAWATSAPILRLLIFLLKSNEDKEQMGKNRNFVCLLALQHKTLLR